MSAYRRDIAPLILEVALLCSSSVTRGLLAVPTMSATKPAGGRDVDGSASPEVPSVEVDP